MNVVLALLLLGMLLPPIATAAAAAAAGDGAAAGVAASGVVWCIRSCMDDHCCNYYLSWSDRGCGDESRL